MIREYLCRRRTGHEMRYVELMDVSQCVNCNYMVEGKLTPKMEWGEHKYGKKLKLIQERVRKNDRARIRRLSGYDRLSNRLRAVRQRVRAGTRRLDRKRDISSK